ncbi:phospho-acceptor domain-containing protein [Paenibacillus taihuensis]|uniref:histidine kinase n=1 Tax=Paenibacillus taihuensis TaxID=1156355 RepID=A0A3D9RRN0_9BACL|nr:ATP-binding protein [Paenibacillus taihuensis]REE78731.1 phospho-acceptor domain-containing protein [Paenibacillus taihuensis]
MFNRTRIQLTIRNAAVLSVILIALNVSVYLVMKDMLMSQIDRSLTGVSNKMTVTAATSASAALPLQKGIIYQVGQMDRPVIQLFWSKDNQPLLMPAHEIISQDQLMRLQPDKLAKELTTVKVGDQYYRVYTKSSGDEVMPVVFMSGSEYQVAKQQLLTNISAETGMLHRLWLILLFGGFVGLLVAVAAGYYLANRALIPIRISLERQQQFVSDASHELRTPLSVIQAHGELLLRHPDHTIEQDSKHISVVLQETRRMSKLVGGLLTLARSDSNQLELDKRAVQLDRIVQDSVGKMQMLAEVKEIILNAETEASVPMTGDEERLHQLLTALLDNAIKYTPEGGVVRVGCRKLAHTAVLEIEDTGIGIAAEHLPHVFDRFYRADKARTRQEGGTGLGLAIAKWIVDRHGGKLRVESKLGVGTRVVVTLPLSG